MQEMKIGDWLDKWFSVYTGEMAEKTISLYKDARRRLKCHFPEIEETFLNALLPMTFQNALNVLGRTYSQSSLRHIKVLYNKIYEAAIENKLVDWNPIPVTKIPKYASQKVVDALTQEEQEAFEKAAATLPVVDHFALMTLLRTGLRRDELRFLKWEDWDVNGKVLHIRKSKTRNGVRDVPVIPEVAMMLTYLSHRRAEKRCSYIFSYRGQQLTTSHMRYICNKVAKIARVPHATPHILRHSFATRMIEHGADPKSLSVIIGHSNVAFTLNRYVTVDKVHLADQMMLLSEVRR